MDTQLFQKNQAGWDFPTAAVLGMIPYTDVEIKFGHCPTATAVATDIWVRGAAQPLYVFPIVAGEGMEVVSDDPDDDQDIVVLGLDEAGLIKSATVTLTGTTEVALPGLWSSISRAYNDSATLIEGNVVVQGDGSESTNIFALLSVPGQQTSQAIYIVPSNKVAIVRNYSTGLNKPLGATVSCIFALNIAQPGKVFRTHVRYGMQENGTSNLSSNLDIPKLIGPGNKVKVTGTCSSAPADISGAFFMTLVDTDRVPATILAASLEA